MIAVVVEHVVLTAGILLWHLVNDLGQSVVHDGDLAEIYFAVEDIVGPLGFHFQDAWIFGVGRAYTVTIFYIAASKDGYPISTPVWKAPKPIPSRHLLKVRKSYMFRYILNVFIRWILIIMFINKYQLHFGVGGWEMFRFGFECGE